MGWNDYVDANFDSDFDPKAEPDFDAMAEEYMALSCYEEGAPLPGSLSDVEY